MRHPSSALDPTIEAACAAGIVVVSFSQVVTAPCPYKVNTNWASVNHDIPTWMANVLGGKGKILLDEGLPGSPISEASNVEIEKVLSEFPDIEIVGRYVSNYALGDEKTGVASLLAANPQVDGILTAGYGTGAIEALKEAGRPLVPIVAFSYNGTASECATETEPGLECFIYTHPPYLSADAIKLAVDVLDGNAPESQEILNDYPRLTTKQVEGDFSPGADIRDLEVGVNVFPELPPGVVLPIAPDWLEVTPEEAAGTGGLTPVVDPNRDGPARSAGHQQALRRRGRPRPDALRRHRRRSARHPGRERRRQEHAHPDPEWRPPRGCRLHRPAGNGLSAPDARRRAACAASRPCSRSSRSSLT